MSRRAPAPTEPAAGTPRTRPTPETDAPLVPDLTRTGRPDRTATPTDTASDRAGRRRRRDPFELALMEDSE
ncbi:hypothetical protein [Halobaculum litoreum]|uniref:Uncharacterized protein n=1 Tax=Halobaculum litoreum TaxID=3031998 RepID=A0ABD5XMD0_9EURY|nr:hypothetical protein [Halobaculum sp. DT92]